MRKKRSSVSQEGLKVSDVSCQSGPMTRKRQKTQEGPKDIKELVVILDPTEVQKYFKQKKQSASAHQPSTDVHRVGLDRTVNFSSNKILVITRKFNVPPKVENEPVKLKLHENNDSVVKKKYPESNHGQTTDINFNIPNQSQEQFKNTHINNEVTQLKRFKDKSLQKSIDEKQLNGTVPSELKCRNLITLEEKDSFDQVVQPIQEDDDASFVLELSVSSSLVALINDSLDENKLTEFDRLSQYNSAKEEGDQDEKCNDYALNSVKAEPSDTHAEMDSCTSSPLRLQRGQFLDKDPLENSPFKGYCMLYFRTSIDEHPCCILMHKVPNHVLSTINSSPDDVIRTDCAISEIVNENFINPPVGLVLLFVSFCLRFSKEDTLVRVGQSLKNNYDGESHKALEIWYNFFKEMIGSSYDLKSKYHHRCAFISMTLQKIFERINVTKVFTVVLKALVKLHSDFKPKVQLLMCIDFLFKLGTKEDVLKLIPIEFAIAVINQCLYELIHNNKTSFVYKVLRTFFDDVDYAQRLYLYDKDTFSLFVKTLQLNNIGTLSSQIKQLQMSGLKTSSLENLECTKTYSDSPTQQIDALGRTIKCANDPRSLCAALERNFEIRAFNTNEIYTQLKSTFKNELFYSALSLLRDPVKESLSDVIMSFISHEAYNKRWDVCLKLYKSLCFNPRTIKNFCGNNSPVSNLLTVVSVYLNNYNIMEALKIFTKHNLCKDDSYWELDFCPYDLEERKLVCATFRDALHSVDTQELYTVVMMLIPLQKSLEEPINLTSHLTTLISGLIEKRLDSKAAKLIGLIFDGKKSKSFLLASHHFYRALVVILCNAEEYSHAAMLYCWSQKHIPLYSRSPIKFTGSKMPIEFYSCVTKQEMLAVFFGVLKLHGDQIKDVGFLAKFNIYPKQSTDKIMPDICDPYLSLKDESVGAAIQRFKRAVRELIPNAIFNESWLDAIEVDKKSLQEYMYKLNHSA